MQCTNSCKNEYINNINKNNNNNKKKKKKSNTNIYNKSV